MEKVLKLEDILNTETTSEEINKAKNEKKKDTVIIPRGVPKSGRTWKSKKKRFSSIIMTPGYKKANKFEKLQNLKKDLSRIRNITKNRIEKRKEEIEKKKERRRNNLKRQEQNRLKSEVVQVMKNSAKIKRMKKKLLRKIEKRDTLNMK